MIAVHAIYEDGRIEFVFDAPRFSGPRAVLVIFPDEDVAYESLDVSGGSPWPDLEDLL